MTTAMGRLFYHVIGSFAEFEREMIIERVRAGLANARAKGKSLGPPEGPNCRTAYEGYSRLSTPGIKIGALTRRSERIITDVGETKLVFPTGVS